MAAPGRDACCRAAGLFAWPWLRRPPPANLIETPMLRDDVAAKKLPPVKQRLPENPLVVAMDGKTQELGQHGGTLNMLIGARRATSA